jgi:hypothetical protein
MSSYDPFAPPVTDPTPAASPPTAPSRPTGAPKVFGILSIVFASVMLVYSLLKMLGGAVAGTVAGLEGRAGELESVMAAMARVYRALAWEGLLVGLLSGLLIAIGIGQVRYRAWARRWTLYWAAAAMATVLVMIGLSVLVVGPAYGQMMEQLARMAPDKQLGFGGFGRMFGGGSAVATVLVYMPYPILLAIFFSRPNVRAAMMS